MDFSNLYTNHYTVTLLVVAAVVLCGGGVNADGPKPPPSGTWEITADTVLSDAVLSIPLDIHIHSCVHLSLVNSTLFFNSSTPVSIHCDTKTATGCVSTISLSYSALKNISQVAIRCDSVSLKDSSIETTVTSSPSSSLVGTVALETATRTQNPPEHLKAVISHSQFVNFETVYSGPCSNCVFDETSFTGSSHLSNDTALSLYDSRSVTITGCVFSHTHTAILLRNVILSTISNTDFVSTKRALEVREGSMPWVGASDIKVVDVSLDSNSNMYLTFFNKSVIADSSFDEGSSVSFFTSSNVNLTNNDFGGCKVSL